jgi:regulator of protease activity HflC (stomatin/prohibitin superfamily)
MQVAMILVSVFLVGSIFLFREVELGRAARFGVVILALAPMVAWVIGFKRWLRTIDELERLIQLQSLSVALGSSSLMILGYGLMVQAELLSTGPRSSAWVFLWAWIFGVWSLSQAVIRRRYQE